LLQRNRPKHASLRTSRALLLHANEPTGAAPDGGADVNYLLHRLQGDQLSGSLRLIRH